MIAAPGSDIASLLDTAAPPLSAAAAEDIALTAFGLDGRASELTGERDRNFHLVAGGQHYVLKVSNPAEDRDVIDFQTRALLHIAANDDGLPVPRMVPTLAGDHEWLLDGDAPRVVRVLTYLQGEPLHRVESGPSLRRNLGVVTARLDLALKEFAHPASSHELMWDLQHASCVRELLVHIGDKAQRALAMRFLDQFEAFALPKLADLRAQVIHNDLNPHNVLVSPEDHSHVAGIIDFGDMVHAPLVDNIAVAAAYHLTPEGHPLANAGETIAAYHAVLPLEAREIDLLFDLIATRMVLTVAITAWRAARYPENAPYILRNNPRAWAGLERFSTLDRREAQAYLHTLCQEGR